MTTKTEPREATVPAGITDGETVLEVTNLTRHFPVAKSIFHRSEVTVHAVDGVSFTLRRGETLGLLGESGCGKSTVARLVLHLDEPTEGDVTFRGRSVFGMKGRDELWLRRRLQVILQDPYASLNPRHSVGRSLRNALDTHHISRREEGGGDRVAALLDRVGLSPEFAQRFPHELSGGQRQRVAIARSLAVNPEVVVCDEPVSALDVSIQGQILNLLLDLQKEQELSYLFISHNIAVVAHMSHRIAVMYLGQIVEIIAAERIFAAPAHPYTYALISAMPHVPLPGAIPLGERIVLQGELPSPTAPPPGCRFNTRCPWAMDICREVAPSLVERSEGHFVACHLDEIPVADGRSGRTRDLRDLWGIDDQLVEPRT